MHSRKRRNLQNKTLLKHVKFRGGSSFSLRGGGGYNLKKKIICKGIEGPAPGEFFDFQRLSHAI